MPGPPSGEDPSQNTFVTTAAFNKSTARWVRLALLFSCHNQGAQRGRAITLLKSQHKEGAGLKLGSMLPGLQEGTVGGECQPRRRGGALEFGASRRLTYSSRLFPSLCLSFPVSKMDLASVNPPFTYSVCFRPSWEAAREVTPPLLPTDGSLRPKERRRLEPRPGGGCRSSVPGVSGRCQRNLNLQLQTFGEKARQEKQGPRESHDGEGRALRFPDSATNWPSGLKRPILPLCPSLPCV